MAAPGIDSLGAARSREAWVRQVQENSARLALSSAPVETTGWGPKVIKKMIDFGATYTEQPTCHHGYALSDDEDDEAVLVDGRWPRAMGFVRAWESFEQNGTRFYTGAYVAVIVDTIGPTDGVPIPFDDPGYVLEHTFLFTGIAMKEVPAFLGDSQS